MPTSLPRDSGAHRADTRVVPCPPLLVALLVWWAARSDSEAAPPTSKAGSTSQAGRITFDALPGGVRSTLPLRSFRIGGTSSGSPVGGGGGAGKFTAEDPAAVVDASNVDPLLLRAGTTGVHLESVTVTLFRPSTTTRQQTWELEDVTVGALHTAQSGSATSPRVSVGLRYARVTATTYDATGAAVRSYCFDVAANVTC